MKSRVPHEVSPSLLLWVGAGHAVVLVVLLLLTFVMQPEKPQPVIELVDLGGGAVNPREVSTTRAIPQPSPQSEPTPQPQARPREVIKRKDVQQPPVRKRELTKPLERTSSKPKKQAVKKVSEPVKKAAPKKHVVRVNTEVTTSSAPQVSTSTSTQPKIDRSTIQKSLSSSLRKLEFTGPGAGDVPDSFKALLKRVLERNWRMPSDISGSDFTVVWVTVRKDGTIIPGSKVSSSGHQEMDRTVLAAVRAAGHLGQSLPAGVGNPDFRAKVRFEP